MQARYPLHHIGRALLVVAWCGGVAPATPAPAPRPRPNILVVVVDDLRWDELGAAGHPYVKTPNIDRIAREGARFTNAFATTPLCSPSRASLLTGLYARTHGIVDNTDRSARSHQLATFPRVLQGAGYETAFIGKWHMGVDDSRRPGFDEWVGMKGQGEAIDPELNDNGRRTRVKGYVTDIFTDRALAFLARPRQGPFLLYIAHKALHPNTAQAADGSVSAIGEGGFIAAERHRSLYAADVPPRRPSVGTAPRGKPALLRRIGDLPPLGPATGTDDGTIRDRQRMLAAVDESMGRILSALEESGRLDDTVFVFTSDHGYFYGEHGLSQERRLAYEETIRIPLFIRYPPRVKAGTTPARFALTIDLAPTLVELAGAPAMTAVEGRSLVPLLEGRSTPWRSAFLIEYWSDTVFPRMLTMGYDAVRGERYKYIRFRELEGMDELYDLQSDPYEMTNLVGDARKARVLARMKAELQRLLGSPAGLDAGRFVLQCPRQR